MCDKNCDKAMNETMIDIANINLVICSIIRK